RERYEAARQLRPALQPGSAADGSDRVQRAMRAAITATPRMAIGRPIRSHRNHRRADDGCAAPDANSCADSTPPTGVYRALGIPPLLIDAGVGVPPECAGMPAMREPSRVASAQ